MKATTMLEQGAKRLERQRARDLQEQARMWQLAKHVGRYRTDQGVPVVRRHKRRMTRASAA
jgi:hypothetical protein